MDNYLGKYYELNRNRLILAVSKSNNMTTSMIYKMPSTLQGKSIKECQQIAIDIASETFIKNGNHAISFTDNQSLRIVLGGRYQSYVDLAQVMIAAYNDKQAELILANL